MHVHGFSECIFNKQKKNLSITYSYIFLFVIVHVRKRNTLVNGCIISSEYPSQSEMIKRKTYINPSLINVDENKHVRPYFLIRPQTVLMLPNETGKFNEKHFY
jgi:hypothetical protein